ncbi:hypothetical protein [Nesterenkonia rhizosphaerae]|uniref:Uncharacterized protein n=1 Tax=Nesterenkonia rhizosphaerae TaxID=1348272 RepID=A0ABP9FZY3_9MICC
MTKTGGGRGTNQHRIKGTSQAKKTTGTPGESTVELGGPLPYDHPDAFGPLGRLSTEESEAYEAWRKEYGKGDETLAGPALDRDIDDFQKAYLGADDGIGGEVLMETARNIGMDTENLGGADILNYIGEMASTGHIESIYDEETGETHYFKGRAMLEAEERATDGAFSGELSGEWPNSGDRVTVTRADGSTMTGHVEMRGTRMVATSEGTSEDIYISVTSETGEYSRVTGAEMRRGDVQVRVAESTPNTGPLLSPAKREPAPGYRHMDLTKHQQSFDDRRRRGPKKVHENLAKSASMSAAAIRQDAVEIADPYHAQRTIRSMATQHAVSCMKATGDYGMIREAGDTGHEGPVFDHWRAHSNDVTNAVNSGPVLSPTLEGWSKKLTSEQIQKIKGTPQYKVAEAASVERALENAPVGAEYRGDPDFANQGRTAARNYNRRAREEWSADFAHPSSEESIFPDASENIFKASESGKSGRHRLCGVVEDALTPAQRAQHEENLAKADLGINAGENWKEYSAARQRWERCAIPAIGDIE